MDNFFQARDEIIDAKDDIQDYWDGELMKESVVERLSNALALLEDLRKELDLPDKQYTPDS